MKFVDDWKNRGNEKSDSQKFWISLIELLGKDKSIIEFERQVKIGDKIFYIDALIDGGRVLVEQKSFNVKIDKLIGKESAFAQASQYFTALTIETHKAPDWIVLCNFQKFLIYDMRLGIEFSNPENKDSATEILLEDLPEKWEQLRFLVDKNFAEDLHRENVSIQCGSKLREIHHLLNKSNRQDDSLNRFFERIVFCFYAENAELFPPESFRKYLHSMDVKSDLIPTFRRGFSKLFGILNKKDRDQFVDPMLDQFPYVNGNLFEGEHLDFLNDSLVIEDPQSLISSLDQIIKKFSWKNISPPIFGAIFEQILSDNDETLRRKSGIHYTSIANIHKLIDPLFLDKLNREFETCEDLEKFHDKIARLKFFDPACGSGNFLTETYISIRKLENRIIEKTHGSIKVSIENFYGIEIEPFAVRIAKLALWISENQMNGNENFLPLKKDPRIICGNSLEIDWKKFVPDADFIIGNPPYIGYSNQSANQKLEMRRIFEGHKAAGKMDYVCAWFKKAAEYIRDSTVEVGFVATNSICQGEHVGFLWKDLFDDGIKINFAWSTFKWSNESPDKKSMAQVFCVIVGFARFDRKIKLLDGVEVSRINGYLQDAPNVCIESRRDSLMDVPKMTVGNRPADGGNLIIEAKDLDAFVEKDPRSKKFIRKLVGGEEFIKNLPRYCLWLIDAEPSEIKSIKPIYERVEACRNFRLNSKAKATREELSKTPMLVEHNSQPSNGNFIVIPFVSGERREYIPIGYLDSEIIASDQLRIIPNGSLWLFGVLISRVHMAWMRSIAGRVGVSYRYTASIVYNNFPFPNHNPKIESTAQKILDARSNHKNSSLAELYDPNLMPPDLRKAHDENDRAVLDSYGFSRSITESEIVARLFEMYQSLTK